MARSIKFSKDLVAIFERGNLVSPGSAIAIDATKAFPKNTEVEAMRRLAYTHLIDFVPDVKAYNVATVVELHAKGSHIRMVIILNPMHSQEWTDRAVSGMTSQLTKLDKLFPRLDGK